MEVLPAPGVMQTKPVIIPWMAPIMDGFLKNNISQHTHTSRLVAVQIWVFRTAIDESTFAEKGSPPLKPDQPIHKIPAPTSASRRLFGGNSSLSSFNRGPTCHKRNQWGNSRFKGGCSLARFYQ